MKHLASLIIITLTIVGFAPAQSITVSQDTVYEIDNDGGNNVGPITEITIFNTTSDTLFTDTVIVDLLTSPVPEHINFQFGIKMGEVTWGGGVIDIIVSEDYQRESIGAGPFAQGVEYKLRDFCLDVLVEGHLVCGRAESENPSDYILALVKVRWYFTNGDSLSFFVKGDYLRESVPVARPLIMPPILQREEGINYQINGKSIKPDRIRKTPLPMIRRTKDAEK